MTTFIKNTAGTTLIEIALYFAIVGTILMAALVFAIQMMDLTATSQNFSELQANQDFIVQKITETVQEADNINLDDCVFDNPDGRLSLNMPNVFDSPTKFYLENKDLFIQKANNSPIQLNADTIVFDSLEFKRITGGKAPDQIILNADFSPENIDITKTDQDFNLHLTVSLRK